MAIRRGVACPPLAFVTRIPRECLNGAVCALSHGLDTEEIYRGEGARGVGGGGVDAPNWVGGGGPGEVGGQA